MYSWYSNMTVSQSSYSINSGEPGKLSSMAVDYRTGSPLDWGSLSKLLLEPGQFLAKDLHFEQHVKF